MNPRITVRPITKKMKEKVQTFGTTWTLVRFDAGEALIESISSVRADGQKDMRWIEWNVDATFEIMPAYSYLGGCV